MDIQKVTIGEKIKKWRKIKEMTQDELSKKADIPYPTLVKIESGAVNNPSIETMMKIANGLGVTLDELIGFIGSKKCNCK
ncbi:helix-turn-helix domain-containing protein [Candidatus Peregrinibacteria bacterium]|nr:helix-turn-helix domain-containing protein [Candidatus Peregrinibacteria bacterium]